MKAKYVFSVSVLFSFLILPFNACKFLDVDDFFNETLKYDSIFSNKRNIERYLWAAAASFPDEGDIFFGQTYTPGIVATDEAFSLGGSFRGRDWVTGRAAADENFNQYSGFYRNMYQIIRKANTILVRMNEASDMTAEEKSRIKSYTHFLRGYAYYQLLMLYGPAIILDDEIMNTNEDVEYYATVRSTYDESIEYICDEFEQAAKFMDWTIPAQNYGRPTPGAALALIARLRLQHASPLFNGGDVAKNIYRDFLRSSDNKHYIQQTYNEERWARAAMSAKRVMNTHRYWLHTVDRSTFTPILPATVPSEPFPTSTPIEPYPASNVYGAGGIDHYHSYHDMFDGETVPTKNPEIIWGSYSGAVGTNISRCFPVTTHKGSNNMCVTQKVVDAYYMDDGRTKEEVLADGELSYYNEMEFLYQETAFSEYVLAGGDIPVNKMYVNREMRFYANVSFDGIKIHALTLTNQSYQNQNFSYQYTGNAGKSATGDGDQNSYPITGYTLRKYVSPYDAVGGLDGARLMPKHFPIIRYAEILLSYVEAINHLTRSYTLTDVDGKSYTLQRDPEEIRYYFNYIRYRAGLPGMTEEQSLDPAKVQELIERERMIEFMAENRRYFDVRRWGIYQQSEREPMMGMNTDASGSEYFIRKPLNHAFARERAGSDNPKLIFYPLPLKELRKAPSLDQNPGWER